MEILRPQQTGRHYVALTPPLPQYPTLRLPTSEILVCDHLRDLQEIEAYGNNFANFAGNF